MLLDVHCSCVSPALYASVQVLQQWGEEHKYNKASEEAMSCVLTIPSHTQWCEILKYFDAREHDLVSLLQLSLQLYCWSIVGNIALQQSQDHFLSYCSSLTVLSTTWTPGRDHVTDLIAVFGTCPEWSGGGDGPDGGGQDDARGGEPGCHRHIGDNSSSNVS